MPLKCLNFSDCGGGFRMPNTDSDKGGEGERDHDRAFRSFEATSGIGLFQSPPRRPLAICLPPTSPQKKRASAGAGISSDAFGGMHPAVLSQVI